MVIQRIRYDRLDQCRFAKSADGTDCSDLSGDNPSGWCSLDVISRELLDCSLACAWTRALDCDGVHYIPESTCEMRGDPTATGSQTRSNFHYLSAPLYVLTAIVAALLLADGLL